jgi:SAM-dependent methyltransferase
MIARWAANPQRAIIRRMKLNAEDLAKIASSTLEHYDERAEDYWQGTHHHDVQQNIDALLHHIEGKAPFTILDFGCGPGRDLITFAKLGHKAIGVDGSLRFVEMARANSGCEAWHQDFLHLDLPAVTFDGVFANASMFHIPSQELQRVLRDLHNALKPRGVLFASNPRGDGSEGWNGKRYGAYYDLETWRGHLTSVGFTELEYYYRPTGLPFDQQRWLASVWRK